MNNDPITCSMAEGSCWIHPSGHACFLNSTAVKEIAKSRIDEGVRQFVVVLSDCVGMDSTFIGTLAGIALRLREIGQGGVRIVNLPSDIERDLRTLSLEKLFEW